MHIDTGLFGVSSAGLLSLVQDLVITPAWLALLWAVHALVVMLEWSFSLELLGGPDTGGIAHALARMQAELTVPWLSLSLAIASALTAYRGLVRRQFAESLADALLSVVLISAGLWIIADPGGTVGALSAWGDEAGLGTLAVAATGQPAASGGSLASSMRGLFAAAIDAPWCYLEFGDVAWCIEPSRFDGRLHRAAIAIASRLLASRDCSGGASCRDGSERELTTSARLLREAHTNGDLFLALPANGADRNSINQQGSLLRTLCQSSEATDCSGPTAAQAEFRTNRGTWPRLGGLLLIAAGLLGMMLLLGYIAVRLLLAAVLSVFYLLLAPGMVLAPALGEHGRRFFTAWAARLLGAVFSKLLFAFLLGVVLAVIATLESLRLIGWWAQWLLLSAFWWGVFLRRRQILAAAGGARSAPGAPSRSLWRRTEETPRTVQRLRTRGDRRPQPELGARASRPVAGPRRAGNDVDVQAVRMDAGAARGERGRRVRGEQRRRASALSAQLERIETARVAAVAAGDGRRSVKLAGRSTRVAAELAAVGRGVPSGSLSDESGAGRPLRDRTRFLDLQAGLPASREPARGRPRRDYAAMAGLAGYRSGEYERLPPGPQRAARLQIDRELALRRPPGPAPALPPPEHGSEAGPGGRLPGGSPPGARAGHPGPGGDDEEDEIFADMRAVAEGRKRQFGIGRP